MCHLETLPVDVRNVPKLAELGEPRLEQPDRRGITIHVQVADSIRNERNGDVHLGRDPRINAAITDVCDLETARSTRLQEANAIVGRLAAQMEVRAQRRCQRGQSGSGRFRDDSEWEMSLGA